MMKEMKMKKQPCISRNILLGCKYIYHLRTVCVVFCSFFGCIVSVWLCETLCVCGLTFYFHKFSD